MTRHAIWPLVFVLLSQWFMGSAWAMRGVPATGLASACHEVAVSQISDLEQHHAPAAQGKAPTHTAQADSHHCCAVGLGAAVQPLLLPLPHAIPASPHSPWASLSLRPDLRPPI